MPFYDPIRVGAAGAGGYEIERSLRFNAGDGPYLGNTPSSHSNKKTMTFSFWFKRVVNNNFVSIFRSFGNSDNRHSLDFLSGGQIRLWGNYNGSVAMTVQTSQVFRDPAAWYHFVLALDTTQGTASNRVKMYVNGEQITSFSNTSYPSQDFEFGFNDQNVETQIGVPNDTQCNYYIAEFQEIEGSQLTPSSFGETNAVTGQWNPKKYVGSYGTNGFYLNFSDNTGTTATTLGKDSSGNGRNFTPYNFSVSAGEGNDSVEDTPTNNWATLNSLDPISNVTFSEGNLKAVRTNAGNIATSNFVVHSGKWYMEMKYVSGTSNHMISVGFSNPDRSYKRLVRGGDGELTPNTGNVSVSFADPDVLMLALDADNGKWYIGKNGSFMLSGDPANGTGFVHSGLSSSDGFIFMVVNNTSAGGQTISANFGQQGFSYTPPSGFKAFNSQNLPDPTILLPNKHFDSFLYSATGNAMSFTDLNFQPDWIWQKRRDNVGSSHFHYLFDSVRGGRLGLQSNTDGAEFTGPDPNITFTSNGYDMAASTGGQGNGSGGSYVSWNWNAGDTASKTYRVVVSSAGGSGNKYRFRNSANSATFAADAVTLDLEEGGTYIFNMDDSSNASHPFSIGTAANGTVYTSGITYFLDGVSKTYNQYTSGFASASTRRLHITVPASAPVLYYWCSVHSGMGGQINTNSTFGSSNFDGSTQSTVKANTTAGFSIVLYTGQQNATDTIGHGLGVEPQVVISKSRNSTYTYTQWYVYHHKLTTNYFLFLNKTNAQGDGLADYYVDASFSSTVFAVGDDIYGPNVSNNNYVAYCFSEVKGYSKFGSYTGNGNSDGAFVFTGFRPAWIMVKRSSGTEDWAVWDSVRDSGSNPNGFLLRPNSSTNEGGNVSGHQIDILSNGFKLRNTDSKGNGSGSTYIYLAFAESPFKNSRAR